MGEYPVNRCSLESRLLTVGIWDSMKDHAAQSVSDDDFAARAERWPRDTPDTKEAYHIREVFDSLFPSEAAAKTAVRCVMFFHRRSPSLL
jgi:hypothetical protein